MRFSLRMLPATENISSERTLVAGILKYRLVNLAINGYWLSLIYHHISGLSSMSIHSSPLYLSTSATTHSNLDFFHLSLQMSAKNSDSLLFFFAGSLISMTFASSDLSLISSSSTPVTNSSSVFVLS